MNSTEFNNPVPLATAAISNPAYGKNTYWRGGGGVDQFFLALVL